MLEVEIDCPYCGEPLPLAIDETGGRQQTYVEDCGVCCRPIELTVRLDSGACDVSARPGDGS
jgi:hypothetical protein